MLRLNKVLKSWKEAGSLNAQINLYGFWNETAFLTKSGDLGMVLSVPGVDYESFDHASQEYAVKRLEAALKNFGPGYQENPNAISPNQPGSSMIAPRAAGDPPPASPAQDSSKHGPQVNIDSAVGQPYVIYEGLTMDTVLMNRLDGDAVGPVTDYAIA